MPKTKKKMIPKFQGKGPTLIDAAMTSKPHLRQRGHEIRIVDIDGKKLVEVPLMRKGIFSHPWADTMIFDDEFFETMIENHKNKVTDYPPILDLRHTDSQGALAFLDPDDGGRLEVKDNWLTAFGPPVDEKAEEIINSRRWRFSSAHFHPDYQSNLLRKLSDGRRGITLEECTEIKEGDDMPDKKTITIGGNSFELEDNGNGFVLTDAVLGAIETSTSDVSTTKQSLQEANGKIVILEKTAVTLKAEIVDLKKDDEDDPEMSDAVRLMFEAQKAQTEAIQAKLDATEAGHLKSQIAVTLKAAQEKTVDGYGYAKPFLDLVQAGFTFENIETEEGETIKLEKGDEPTYIRGLLTQILEVGLERVPRQSKTENDEIRLGNGGNGNGPTKEEIEAELKIQETR